jgi:DNA-directed RNA polymerase specialized sigma24 family protein
MNRMHSLRRGVGLLASMAHGEIALALQVPLGTVKSDLTRGCTRLGELLDLWSLIELSF